MLVVVGWLVGWFTFVDNVFIAVLIVVAVYKGLVVVDKSLSDTH